jgi:hypothetical protein
MPDRVTQPRNGGITGQVRVKSSGAYVLSCETSADSRRNETRRSASVAFGHRIGRTGRLAVDGTFPPLSPLEDPFVPQPQNRLFDYLRHAHSKNDAADEIDDDLQQGDTSAKKVLGSDHGEHINE